MKKILDITANYAPYFEGFNINEEMSGRIVLSDDNTFEGIICNVDDNFLVTGKIEDKTVEMLQQEKNCEKLYIVRKEGRTYYGDCFIKYEDLKQPIGQSMMRIKDPKEYRPVDEEVEINYLEKKILEKKHTK